MDDETYDVVVIGGGAAGLSGALALGRARRSVLVVDAGEPRNAPAGHVHNYLGREGTPPGELLAIGRREVQQYGVQVHDGTVRDVSRQPDGTFLVTLADRSVAARRLLVTTGLVDELPDVPGVAEGWGRTVLHCPYCHGWEVRDQALGVLATSALAVHQALMFRQWSADVVLFLHTAPQPTDDEAEQLAARGIRVVEGEVAAWEPDGVRLADGELVPRQALVVATTLHARADALVTLGLTTTDLEMGGQVVGSFVASDPTGMTAVPGVWVAGNVADPRAQVITSAAAGLTAGAALNGDLIAEDTRIAVDEHRVFGQDAWEARYREKEDRIWSGRPNPVLVAEATDLAPGSALDVGCGEGADALWLAARGWRVTATDISTVALARAAAQAEAQGLDVGWRHADLLADPPEADAYDLVTAQFMHLPADARVRMFGRLAEAVAPGGTLLLVGHHPLDLQVLPRLRLRSMLFTPEQLVAELALDPDTWQVLVAEARPRQAEDPDGHPITVHDTVLRARRT
ncbi:methyltransferase domain-containing protein [Cellulomonas sp. P22]|uniref:methyltransferase domain-containing protein n=1 Tax=Cellulomonas sp. P22 TaxID=3373189 RepID=UPI003794D25B